MKMIILQSSVDKNATSWNIDMKPTRLDTTFADMGYNIQQLNLYVLTGIEGLDSRWGTTIDLSFHLFKAYKTSPDSNLVDYVNTKHDAYDKGTDITAKEIIQMIRVNESKIQEEKE